MTRHLVATVVPSICNWCRRRTCNRRIWRPAGSVNQVRHACFCCLVGIFAFARSVKASWASALCASPRRYLAWRYTCRVEFMYRMSILWGILRDTVLICRSIPNCRTCVSLWTVTWSRRLLFMVDLPLQFFIRSSCLIDWFVINFSVEFILSFFAAFQIAGRLHFVIFSLDIQLRSQTIDYCLEVVISVKMCSIIRIGRVKAPHELHDSFVWISNLSTDQINLFSFPKKKKRKVQVYLLLSDVRVHSWSIMEVQATVWSNHVTDECV
jgi:hypothetical protein